MAEKLSSVVKEDGVYKRSEINKAISIMETKDLGELKGELGDLRVWINGELRNTQERYLNRGDVIDRGRNLTMQNYISSLGKFLDDKHGTLLDPKDPKGKRMIVRCALAHLKKECGYEFDLPSSYEIGDDSEWGEADFLAVMAFQKSSPEYKKVYEVDGSKGKPDGIIGPRTLHALMESCGMVPEQINGYVKTTETWKMRQDGTVYLPGPDGKWKPYAYEQKKYETTDTKGVAIEAKNLSLPLQKLNLFLQFYEGWKEQALQIANSRNKMNSKWFADEGAQIKSKISQMEIIIKNTVATINKNPKATILYNKFFTPIYQAEDIEDILGADDIKTIEQTISNLGNNGYESAELKIMSSMRRAMSDAIADSFGLSGGGNSEYAKNWLADERILKLPDYRAIAKVLEEDTTVTSITAGDLNGLVLQLQKGLILNKNAVPIAKEIMEQYKKFNKNNNKQLNEYREAIKAQGSDAVTQKAIMENWNKTAGMVKVANWNDYVTRATEEAIKSATIASTMMVTRDQMIEGKLTQRLASSSLKNPITKEETMIKDMLGVGVFDVSDQNAEYFAEAGQTIALSAVTMGVGGIAARGALMGAKWLGKVAGLRNLLAATLKATRAAGYMKTARGMLLVGKYGVNTVIEGTAFYQGSNTSTNIITKESVSTLFENATDWKENIKSVVFIGVLKGLNTAFTRLLPRNPGLGKSLIATNRGRLIPRPGALVGSEVLQNFGKLMIQGGMMTTTSQVTEFMFEGEMHWTWEEFIQACLLTRIMHTAGKFTGGEKVKITKDPKTKEIIAKVEHKLLPPRPEQKQITQGSRITNPVKTDTNPVKTDTNPVKTDTNPVKTDTNPVKTDTNPVKTKNLDGLNKKKGDLEREIADRKAELEHKKKSAMGDPEKRGNSQGTGTFSPSEVIEYREQQKKLAEEQSIIDAKQKELDTINREINDINAQKILAQKEGDHRNQHDQLYKDHEALLKALEDSYGSYNQAESSLKTKTATAGHRNDLESNLTQKEKNGQKILTDITKVEKEINQKRNADGLPEVDFDAIHNQVNKRPIKSGTGSNKPSGDIVGQKHTDAPMTGLVGLDGRPLSATKVESRVASDKAEQVIGTSEQINKGEIAPKPEGVVDGKDVKANDNQKINEQVALDNAVTIQKGLEAANKAAGGEVVVEKIKPNIQIESTTGGDIVEIDYLGVKNTKVKVIETLADGSKVVEFTEQTVSNKAGDRKTISQQTWETLKPKEVTKGEKLTDQSDTKMEPTKENIELSNSKIEALQNKYHELATEISNNKDPLKRPKLLAELKAVSKELESARKELLGIGDVPVVIENPELTSAKNLSQKLGERIKDEKDPVKRESLEDQKQKLDERVKSEEEKQKQDEQKKITEEQKQENKESQETTKSKLDAKKSEYSNLASQIEIAKLAEKTPENKQKVADLEQKIRDNVREVQDLKYQELVERYPEHAQTYKDWKSAQEQYGKAREDYFKDLADPSKEMSDTQYTEARKNMYDLERKLRDLSWKDLSQEMKQKSEKKFQDDITLIDERYNLAMENSAYKLNQKLGNTDATIPVEIEKNSQRIAEIDKKLGTKSALFDEHKRIDDAIDSRIENAGKDVNGKESSDSKEKKKKEEGSRVLNFIKGLKLRVGWAIPVGLGIMGAAYACSDKE